MQVRGVEDGRERVAARHPPRAVLGTMTFGDRVDRTTAADMVSVALDAGVRSFDTANNYTGGTSERWLGAALAARRDQVEIATKVRNPVDAEDPDGGLSRSAIPRAVTASLQRLGTDHLDLLYFHRPDWEVDLEESLEAANALIDAGTVGRLGLSNFPAWLIAEAHAISARCGWPPPRVHQFLYNLTAREPDGEYARFSGHVGMEDVVFNPLAGGLLTGRYRQRGAAPGEGRFAQPMYRERYWHPRILTAVDALIALADEHGCSPVSFAYRWLASRELVDAVLIGASGPAQLEENLAAAAEPPLEGDVLAACDRIWAELRGPAPSYWR